MKIYSDFTSYKSDRKDGLNRYIESFLTALSKKNYRNDFFISSSSEHAAKSTLDFHISNKIFKQPNFKAVFARYFNENILIPFKKKFNFYYSPLPEAPMYVPKKMKRIITVHDLLPVKYPDVFPKAKYHYLVYLKFLLKRVDKIIAVSEFTKNEILDYYGGNLNIDVVYQGYNKEKFYKRGKNEFDSLNRRYGLESGYILAVGETRKYKNFHMILEALSKIKNRNIKLVIVGKINRLDTYTKKIIKDNKLENRVVLTDYISDDDLSVLYSFAELFVFPSKYEGFGIPVLEALACRTKILLSDIAPFHEIIGDYGDVFFDPYLLDDLVEKIDYTLENPSVLTEACISLILQKFDWDITVDTIYKKIKDIYI